MISSASDASLAVSSDGTAGPYVIVTSEQLRPVIEALRGDGIRFLVEEEAVLLNGAPALAVIDLGRGADVEKIQGVLDRVSAEIKAQGRRRQRVVSRKSLAVWGDAEPMQQFRLRLDGESFGEWVRRLDIETRFRTTLPQRTLAYCFSKRVPPTDRQVAVLMRGHGRGNGEELSVSGVVPLEGREALPPEQHDNIITDFCANLIEPLTRDLAVRMLIYDAPVGSVFEEALSTEAISSLLEFSSALSKATLDTLDMQRWSAFIRQAHQDEALIDPTLLTAWLVEDGFPSDTAERLVQEYESGRRILGEYDQERP
jgi:hypothetical protein